MNSPKSNCLDCIIYVYFVYPTLFTLENDDDLYEFFLHKQTVMGVLRKDLLFLITRFCMNYVYVAICTSVMLLDDNSNTKNI